MDLLHETGEKSWRAFTEYVLNGQTITANNWHQTPSSCMNAGESDVWRINWISYTSWRLSITCIDGVGYGYLATYGDSGFTTGLTMGETGRRGCHETHMADEQMELRRRTQPGSWVAWTQTWCWQDTADQWRAVYIAANEYHVDWGDFSCDPF
ncbi:MAG: hypothetical protein M3327_03135 [Actinomycetota bacterium]|nr:hypothetical protein [Actinomycetota bacterium]